MYTAHRKAILPVYIGKAFSTPLGEPGNSTSLLLDSPSAEGSKLSGLQRQQTESFLAGTTPVISTC